MKMDLAAQSMEAQRGILQSEYARSMAPSSWWAAAPTSMDKMLAYLNSAAPTAWATSPVAPDTAWLTPISTSYGTAYVDANGNIVN
jgi:hypothetical protein